MSLKQRKVPDRLTNGHVSASQTKHEEQDTQLRYTWLLRRGRVWDWVKKQAKMMLEMSCMLNLVLSIPSYACLFLLCCAFPPFWPFVLCYVLYIYFDQSPENGEAAYRYSEWFRGIFVWRNFVSYFPITLHKTVELEPAFEIVQDDDSVSSDDEDVPYRHVHARQDPQSMSDRVFSTIWCSMFWWYYHIVLRYLPSRAPMQTRPTGRKYIFGFHPHGIISMGALGAFATEGASWSTIFPGIPVSVLTLANQFVVPFYREMLLGMGMGSVSRRNCQALLGRGQSICIIIGGAQESLFARPGCLDLVLNKRKGFIKLALETPGSISLVPVLAFGENDIYEQYDNHRGSVIFSVQQMLKNALGFTLPLLHARGVFNYDVGIMPYRRPIDVVVGEPIDMPHDPHPSPELVEQYHARYVAGLRAIYNKNKSKFCRLYGDNTTPIELRIVE